MNQGAGIMFVCKSENQLKILLGVRTSRPFKGFWSAIGGDIITQHKDENAWQCATRETRETLHINVQQLIDEDKAKLLGSSILKVPFTYRFETFVVALREQSIIDDHPHVVGTFSDIDWFNSEELPGNTHFGVHYTLGVIDAETLAKQEGGLF